MKITDDSPRRRLRFPRHPRGQIPELLVQQVDHAREGVAIARQVCAGDLDAQESRDTMTVIEHAGDQARAHLVDRIATALTTPLDREDIFRASRSIDDVLDNLRDLVREVALWQVCTGEWLAQALDPAAESLELLGKAARTRDVTAARGLCLESRKAAGGIRRHYQEGLQRIFAQELSMQTLKQRELLRRLDIIGLRLTEAADALLDGLVKRST